MDRGVGELVGEQARPLLARIDVRPADAVVVEPEDVDGEGVARLGARDGDGTGECVPLHLHRQHVVGRGVGGELAVGRVATLELDRVAGVDGEDRHAVAIPVVVDGLGGGVDPVVGRHATVVVRERQNWSRPPSRPTSSVCRHRCQRSRQLSAGRTGVPSKAGHYYMSGNWTAFHDE